jgi:hypothetical protein
MSWWRNKTKQEVVSEDPKYLSMDDVTSIRSKHMQNEIDKAVKLFYQSFNWHIEDASKHGWTSSSVVYLHNSDIFDKVVEIVTPFINQQGFTVEEDRNPRRPGHPYGDYILKAVWTYKPGETGK